MVYLNQKEKRKKNFLVTLKKKASHLTAQWRLKMTSPQKIKKKKKKKKRKKELKKNSMTQIALTVSSLLVLSVCLVILGGSVSLLI